MKKIKKENIHILLIIISIVAVFLQLVFLVNGYFALEPDIQYISGSANVRGSIERYTKLVTSGILNHTLEDRITSNLEKIRNATIEKEADDDTKSLIKSYIQGWEGLKVISHKFLEIEDEDKKNDLKMEIVNYSEGLWTLGEMTTQYSQNYSESKLSLLRTIGISIFYNTLLMMALVVFFRINRVEKLERETIFDPLTDSYNRRYLDEVMEKEKSKVDRGNKTFSIIMCDIDYFKKVNDTFGHKYGDEVLVEFSRRIKNMIRKYDSFIRFGGEEFICFLPNTSSSDAYVLSERLRLAINEPEFPNVGNVTASFGVTEYVPKEDTKVTLERVDKALYQAKENGRNRSVLLEKSCGATSLQGSILL